MVQVKHLFQSRRRWRRRRRRRRHQHPLRRRRRRRLCRRRPRPRRRSGRLATKPNLLQKYLMQILIRVHHFLL